MFAAPSVGLHLVCVCVCVCVRVYCVTMMLLDFITCRKRRLLIPVVYRRSRKEVRPRSIWRGLQLLALLQNAKYPWVIILFWEYYS